ncbi:MAG: YihA family ribosome biogenesis GTP-binding protein [Bacilli bacterium]|nr:YihA family ribosome biogenesis GTP-binding protein [Bacilli bacterium]
MKVDNVNLYVSAVRRSQYPEDNLPEFIMLGRSNVGKSSFMNTLVNRKNLARISSKPGKTSTINFFNVEDSFYLVDVPGYGYADTSKEEIRKFGLMVEEYLQKRKELKRVFLLVDFRHRPTSDDKLMYDFLKYYQIPVTVIATKADKVSSREKDKNLKELNSALDIVVGDNVVLFSSVSKVGREEVLKIIEDIIK